MSMSMPKKALNMTPREKVIQARIALLRLYPFFGTMAMHLTPIGLKKEEAEKTMAMPTMGVERKRESLLALTSMAICHTTKLSWRVFRQKTYSS